jgi:hypothetical protein
MGRKNGTSPLAVDPTASALIHNGGDITTDPLPTTKVNKAHLVEIKTALDEAVKKVRPYHPIIHLHS